MGNLIVQLAQHQVLDNQIITLQERLSSMDEPRNIEGELPSGSNAESRPMLIENDGDTSSEQSVSTFTL